MARDFGVTNPEYLKILEEYKAWCKAQPKEYWEEQVRRIDEIIEQVLIA